MCGRPYRDSNPGPSSPKRSHYTEYDVLAHTVFSFSSCYFINEQKMHNFHQKLYYWTPNDRGHSTPPSSITISLMSILKRFSHLCLPQISSAAIKMYFRIFPLQLAFFLLHLTTDITTSIKRFHIKARSLRRYSNLLLVGVHALSFNMLQSLPGFYSSRLTMALEIFSFRL